MRFKAGFITRKLLLHTPRSQKGRRCLCNSLLASIGLAQIHTNGEIEPPILTAGDQVASIASFLKPGEKTYSAKQVLDALLA